MTQVDFYLLQQAEPQARQRVACRITEKAYAAQQRVFIYVETPDDAKQLDDLLWSFRPGSFIPHGVTTAIEPTLPVTIGTSAPPELDAQVLINLAHHVPDFFNRFSRIVEIIEEGHEVTLRQGRERYRHYRHQGITPSTHHLT
ncbi:MAG: DNA polymerase III subunit chi [Gammaproteobacteria bacterium]|nr:DNA polymerase III subunit chi [Gammaproteobacteria bacterium]